MDKDSKNKSYSVFISYASTDADKAKNLVNECKVLGLETWLDEKEIKTGDNWREKLESTIKSCNVAIILISKEALSSNLVSKEWNVICEEKWNRPDIKIIPIILEEAKTPPFLCKYQAYSAEDGVIDYEKIKKYLKQSLGKTYISNHKHSRNKNIKPELDRFANRVINLKKSLKKESRKAGKSKK